jgi:hypothetical protein
VYLRAHKQRQTNLICNTLILFGIQATGLMDVARLDSLVVHRRIRHLELAKHGDGVAIFCTLVVGRLSENAREAVI